MRPEHFWLGRARQMAWRHNLARWLDLFGPALVAAALAGAATLLVLREARASTRWFAAAFSAAIFVSAAVALYRARRRRLSLERALVRMEEHGRLHNRLTSARLGVGAWPEPQAVRDPAQWRWGRLCAPGALSLGLLATSAWIPLPDRTDRHTPHEQPLAWSQVQSWLDTLKQAKVTDPPALEKIENQLDELREKPPEQWYNQSSLEAGDNLRRQTEQSLQQMQQQLREAEQVVSESQKLGQHPAPEQLKQLQDGLSQSLQGLQMGDLPLNKELLKNLQDFHPGQAPQLSQEQIEKLKQQLQQKQAICQQCVMPNRGDGEPCERNRGGPGGGGKTAPLSFKNDATKLHTKETETLKSEDYANALPADLAGITAGEHQVDKDAPAGPLAGGDIATPGAGGDAVWRSAVLPSEQAVLKRFFK